MRPNFFQEDPELPEDSDWQRFELLSAYLDNQVAPSERKQVQQWLDTDPKFKKKYLQMLQIERGLKTSRGVPSVPTEVVCQKVFAKIDQQRRNRQIGLVCSLGLLAVLSFFVYSPKPSWDSASDLKIPEGESLTIALNRPIIELPQP